MRRRRRRRLLAVLLVLLVVVLGLVIWFPARLAWPLLASRLDGLELSGVHGTVWSGQADSARWNGQRLGQVSWQFDRSSVFGHAAGTLTVEAPQWSAKVHWVHAGQDTLRLSDGQGWIDAGLVPASMLQGLQLAGRFVFSVSTLVLRNSWPVTLDADVRWQQARLLVDGRSAVLGDQQLSLQSDAGTTIVGQITSIGDTPLRSRGMLRISPLAWRARLNLRAADAGNTALRRMLARLGKPAPDGSVQLIWRGGLLSGG